MCTISIPVPQSPPFTDSGLPRCKTEPWHIVLRSSVSPPATPCCKMSVARALTSVPPGPGSASESTTDSDHAPMKKASPTPDPCSSPPRGVLRESGTCVARCVAKQVGSVAKVVPVAEATCGLCNEAVSSGPENGEPRLIDGRLVCQSCVHFIEGVEFVPSYSVCLNPLCRRKWKQLTPKMLPHFCPTCKRNLEEGVSGRNHLLAAALMEQMYRRWKLISTELAETLGTQAMPREASECMPRSGLFRNAEVSWRDVLHAFRETFPAAPAAEDVRNWNSVHGRRKLYRGVIHRDHRRFVCTVEALEELNEAFVATRRVPAGARDFILLDWHQQYYEGQEVNFVAFPNPAVSERGTVSKIVRLLNVPDCHLQADGANGCPAFEVDNSHSSAVEDQGVPQLSPARTKECADFSIRAPATGSHESSSDSKAPSQDFVSHQSSSSDSKGRPQTRPAGSKVGGNSEEGPAAIGNNGSDMHVVDFPKMTHLHPVSGSVDTSQGQMPCSAFADLVQWSAEEKDAEPAVLLRAVGAGVASANLAALCGGFGTPLSWEGVLQCIANAQGAPAHSTNPPWQSAGQAVGHSNGNQNHNRATEPSPPASPCSPPLPPRLAPPASASLVHKQSAQGAPFTSGTQTGLQSTPNALGLRPVRQLLRTPPFRSPFGNKGRSPVMWPKSPYAAYFDD